ncbi:unnamed protein product [Lepeophtheirus salmonis]|uniref:(salmon louse) hypothetical protein n=1 Tax=Lepeophtheirus salmonis TaxID=72036 RepID=A0A7R8D166_LEPSM|nr:unnamed protein product [Lepeophtheirus salmonis]CAF2966768.1 unnamed protein product [Lepeophtheirus salmonis]
MFVIFVLLPAVCVKRPAEIIYPTTYLQNSICISTFQEGAKRKLEGDEALGVIEKGNEVSESCSSTYFVPKNNVKIRKVIDLFENLAVIDIIELLWASPVVVMNSVAELIRHYQTLQEFKKLVDDILIFGRDYDELLSRVCNTFARCEVWAMKLSKNKFQLGETEKFSGYTLSPVSTRHDPTKVNAIKKNQKNLLI